MKLAFEEYGSGNPVVLLHAFPFSNKMWAQQIDTIVENNFRLILPDLRGFGKSHNFSDINTMENMANDIAELLENLEIDKAYIGGLSMGGYVALNFYRLYPEKFRAIILCDTTHKADTDEKKNARLDLIEKIETNKMQALVKNVLPNLLNEFTKENNKQLVKELETEVLNTNEQATIATLRGMAARKDHTSILSNIDVPALLIFGEDDKVTDIETARLMNANIADSKLKIIENCGHLSNLEQPKEFNNTLIEFLKTKEI